MFVVIKFIVIGFDYIYCDSGRINLNFLFNCFRDIYLIVLEIFDLK